MPTKLSRYCLGIMEAAWLAAVCVIPIFFNIYSSRIFEPDKIAILRTLALLTFAAWIVKLIEEGGAKWRENKGNISVLKYIWSFPLIGPVICLIIVYLLATIFSVTPSISLFGSYQRLQGTYTTFSYIVIFFSLVVNLRTKNQINRLLTTVIFASLPVSLYGLLQRYQIDPIPWGGNVSRRIASNMGNSIFVAAYLIMVFPLTLGRTIASFKDILTNSGQEEDASVNITKQIIKATLYVFIAALELIAIYMSGSRGPLLGLVVAIYFMVLLFSIFWQKRWLTYTVIGIAGLGIVFLAVFNLQNGPLEILKSSPAIGRFGLLLDPESNSALVRQYIWEGTVKLVGIHEPLKFPDGSSDPFNFLRPIIGYGPEAMYVAYNQYYQPELGQVEKRNASPDRAHNETWDSIVITGIAGLVVYLLIFGSVFYYGLQWQELINTKSQRFFFFICLIGGGIIGSFILIILKGIEFFGVGLPFGMIIGVIGYITFSALFFPLNNHNIQSNNLQIPILIVLLSAIAGHFVEINFGIAIAVTRTLFWTYAGLMLVVGYVLPKVKSVPELTKPDVITEEILYSSPDKKKDRRLSTKKKSKGGKIWRPLVGERPDWIRYSIIGAFIIGLVIATLGYDYVTNTGQSISPFKIILNSVTLLSNRNNSLSFGIIALVLTTWLVGVLLYSSEDDQDLNRHTWIKSLGLMVGGSFFIGFLYWIIHAISLAILASFSPANQSDVIKQVNNIGSLLSQYYIYILLIIFTAALFLPDEWPQRRSYKSSVVIVVIPIILLSVFMITIFSNLQVIHSDITFKVAEPFTKSGQWQVANFLYKRALELAPKEDHYYLYLGRSYLEQAKTTDSVIDQDNLVLQAENDLKVAQSINPLNTDHTANLARLYSWWAGKASTTDSRTSRAEKASDYYQTAVTLSPNNSSLWDEWAVLLMQVVGQSQVALSKLEHALELDSSYSFTHGLLGDYYLRLANSDINVSAKEDALRMAARYYRNAAEVAKKTDQTSKASYLVSLANVYVVMAGLDSQNVDRAQLKQAIDVLLESIDAGIGINDLWKVQEAIANLYLQLGDKSLAQYYANQALEGAPNSVITRIQELISQTLSIP